MSTEMDQNSTCGIIGAAIGFSDEYYDRLNHKAASFIKSSKKLDEIGSHFESVFQVVLSLNSLHFSIKVIKFASSQSYGIISSSNFIVIQIIKKHKKSMDFSWNSSNFHVNIEKSGSKMSVTVNNQTNLHIHKSKDVNGAAMSLRLQPDSVNVGDQLENFNISLVQTTAVLRGYNLPEPFFTSELHHNLQIIIRNLQNPLLPTLFFQQCFKSISPSLPAPFILELQQLLATYSSNCSSVFSRFPSNAIRDLSDCLLSSQSDNDGTTASTASIFSALRPLLELAEMFSGGLRGYARRIVEDILIAYLAVEKKFQNEADREPLPSQHYQNHQSQQLRPSYNFASLVPDDLISHSNLKMKNKLILVMLNYLEKDLPGLVIDLNPTIQKMLGVLTSSIYSNVVARLREVLVICQTPSYEIRKNKIEAILLNSVDGSVANEIVGSLESLIYSNTEFFDIISEFFYHRMLSVSKCALEVYVRRAYMSYQITSFQHAQLSSGQAGAIFKYNQHLLNEKRGSELRRSNSSAGISSYTNLRKYSIINRVVEPKCSAVMGSEDNCPDILLDQCVNGTSTQNDTDTDSAVSLGGLSLSDSITDHDSVLSDYSGGPQQQTGTANNGNRRPPSLSSLNKLDQYRAQSAVGVGAATVTASWTGHSMDYGSALANRSAEMGVSVIFHGLEELVRDFYAVMELLENDANSVDEFLNYSASPDSEIDVVNPLIILNLILNDPEIVNLADDEIACQLLQFCNERYIDLRDNRVIRVTFLLHSMEKDIRYFTYRRRAVFDEEKMYRQIDPALSFQLELNRLSNYKLERISVPNRRMYVYLGKCETKHSVSMTVEQRMFVRCIVHHTDLSSSTSCMDVVAREAERNLSEALEAVEMVASTSGSSSGGPGARANHIFFCFHSVLCLDRLDQLEGVVRAIVLKYGRRLWTARITQAELKMTVRLNSEHGFQMPIRLWVHNEGGKSLEIGVYREHNTAEFGQSVLVAIGSSREARYQGLPVHCFYAC